MKSVSAFLTYSGLFLLLLSTNTIAQSVKLTKVWETDTTVTTPESVFYDSKTNTIYVSCINGGPAPENSKSFIAKVSPDGKVLQRITEGLNSTKGLIVSGNKIYVTEIFKLVEIDLKTGKVIKKYDVPEAKFLNDVTADESGMVYFTDMRNNRIWMLHNGMIMKVSEGGPLNNPNGLLYETGKLLVGNGDGKILAYDIKTKQYTTLAEGMGGIDGLVSDGKKGYFASEWRGKIWHVTPDGKIELLHDTVDQKINTADIDYIPSKKTLLVPTFFVNKVLAFKVD
ncbi:SMP-30/gluconolactonase/LRE family protein [Cytophagaceae bacterium DM2B3-1]|uniref:SMP-30/gluconolactonase/LRE family protein n=1 Tax=Xanthocytophaga flava TaxID=3048013 RepID=A0ABT7CD88_9BACT|nr:SMP-30/gluconolactonase/LRE family protein [Xanthocytophaga flavus]MDJ1491603.1 SMP-30/gluconolactonase/LRE family protein [Xanthocytophaga flavus]